MQLHLLAMEMMNNMEIIGLLEILGELIGEKMAILDLKEKKIRAVN